MATDAAGGIRARIERGFEAWGYFACRHARIIVLLTLLVTAALASSVPRLETDNSTDSFLHPRDPIRQDYDAFRRQFGRDERLTIAIEAPDLFAPEFLERLRALHEELELELPHVEDMISLLNARNTRGDGDRLVVEDLMEEWPETPEQRSELRERVLSNPLYRNTLISRDARVTTVSIELVAFADAEGQGDLSGFGDEETSSEAGNGARLLPEPEISRAVRIARAIVERHSAPDFRLRLAGGPVMSEQLNARMQEDMLRFTAWSLLAIAVCLYLLFRRLAAVVLPLVVVLLAMLGTLGVMSLVGGKISVATQILPSLLLTVGVCDSVHILAIFYQRLQAGDPRERAIAFTLGHSGLAILMTSLTTAGGLGSFAVGELKPVADLGVYAPFGVMLALVYTVVLLPALLAWIPMRPVPAQPPGARDGLTRVLRGLGDFSGGHPWSVLGVALALIVVAAMGASFLRLSHDPMDWFPQEDPLREATLFMNDRLDGVNVVEVLVRTGEENGVQDPALLERLERVRLDTGRIHQGAWHIGKTLSIIDVLKEIHQALNENRKEFYAIPRDRELVAQELLLFESTGSDDLTDFVDPTFSTARVTLRVPWIDAMEYPRLLDDLSSRLRGILGDDLDLDITGLVPVLSRTFRAMIQSMIRSYAVAILVIAPLMVLLIGSLTRGLLSMIPNLTPVILMIGFMGWSGIPVDGLSMMVGAIVLGLAVDDTIHFMHNFRRYFARSRDARAAIRETLETTGRALLVTSLVLAAGFLVFTGAYMRNVGYFGLLTGGTILVAFLANVMLASALMVLATRREARRRSASPA